MCELCSKSGYEEAVVSPVIPWTKIPMCESCLEKYEDGAEIEAIVTKL